MVLVAIDDVQTDTQSLHHGRARAGQLKRCPVTVLALSKDQRIVVTPFGEGLAIFESGLAIAYLFAHHFHVNMSRHKVPKLIQSAS